MLLTGLIVAYGYGVEAFIAWYGGNYYEGFMMLNRINGPYWPQYWALIFCNVIFPQLLWFKKVRMNAALLFVISIVVNIGMWLERFVIIVLSLHRDFVVSSWDVFAHRVGLHDVRRHDGPLHHAVLPVHEVRAHDFDLRSAHAAAGSQGARAARTRHPRLGPLGGISSHARQQRQNRALRADGRVRLGAEHR
jgi:hypothetical protein